MEREEGREEGGGGGKGASPFFTPPRMSPPSWWMCCYASYAVRECVDLSLHTRPTSCSRALIHTSNTARHPKQGAKMDCRCPTWTNTRACTTGQMVRIHGRSTLDHRWAVAALALAGWSVVDVNWPPLTAGRGVEIDSEDATAYRRCYIGLVYNLKAIVKINLAKEVMRAYTKDKIYLIIDVNDELFINNIKCIHMTISYGYFGFRVVKHVRCLCVRYENDACLCTPFYNQNYIFGVHIDYDR